MGCGSSKVLNSAVRNPSSPNEEEYLVSESSSTSNSYNLINNNGKKKKKKSIKGLRHSLSETYSRKSSYNSESKHITKSPFSENDFSTATSVSGTSRIKVTLSNDGSLLQIETERWGSSDVRDNTDTPSCSSSVNNVTNNYCPGSRYRTQHPYRNRREKSGQIDNDWSFDSDDWVPTPRDFRRLLRGYGDIPNRTLHASLMHLKQGCDNTNCTCDCENDEEQDFLLPRSNPSPFKKSKSGTKGKTTMLNKLKTSQAKTNLNGADFADYVTFEETAKILANLEIEKCNVFKMNGVRSPLNGTVDTRSGDLNYYEPIYVCENTRGNVSSQSDSVYSHSDNLCSHSDSDSVIGHGDTNSHDNQSNYTNYSPNRTNNHNTGHNQSTATVMPLFSVTNKIKAGNLMCCNGNGPVNQNNNYQTNIVTTSDDIKTNKVDTERKSDNSRHDISNTKCMVNGDLQNNRNLTEDADAEPVSPLAKPSTGLSISTRKNRAFRGNSLSSFLSSSSQKYMTPRTKSRQHIKHMGKAMTFPLQTYTGFDVKDLGNNSTEQLSKVTSCLGETSDSYGDIQVHTDFFNDFGDIFDESDGSVSDNHSYRSGVIW